MGRYVVERPVLMYTLKAAAGAGAAVLGASLAGDSIRRAEAFERRAFLPDVPQAERVELLRRARGERAWVRRARALPIVVGAVGFAAGAWNLTSGARYCSEHPFADRCR